MISMKPQLNQIGYPHIYEDNQSTICMVKNPQYHGWAKHIDIKFHYIHEQVEKKAVQL